MGIYTFQIVPGGTAVGGRVALGVPGPGDAPGVGVPTITSVTIPTRMQRIENAPVGGVVEIWRIVLRS
jgi:hypothetical protein